MVELHEQEIKLRQQEMEIKWQELKLRQEEIQIKKKNWPYRQYCRYIKNNSTELQISQRLKK